MQFAGCRAAEVELEEQIIKQVCQAFANIQRKGTFLWSVWVSICPSQDLGMRGCLLYRASATDDTATDPPPPPPPPLPSWARTCRPAHWL